METFAPTRDFVPNPRYETQRQQALSDLDFSDVEEPIVDIIQTLSQIPHCFTLQCCWGHFVHDGQPAEHGLTPLANYSDDATINYRIAYLSLCIQSDEAGQLLLKDLEKLVQLDSAYVQFGSPDWFWGSHLNSYSLQVEPERFMLQDTAEVGVKEALYLQSVRDRVFEQVRIIAHQHV